MNIVIMAAGMGKRMHSSLPKVMQPIAGRPMLEHVIAAANGLKPERLIVIYGHGGDRVTGGIRPVANLTFVKQEPQLGTGHAVQQAVPSLDDTKPTLILNGDGPLITAATLKRLADAAGSDKLGLLTVNLENPAGLGRIIRENGRIRRIAEEKDATEEERAVKEIYTGIMVVPTPALKRWLSDLKNDNAQGEYYITDIISKAAAENVEIVSAQPDNTWEGLGVNDKKQQAELERIFQRKQADALMEAGVTLADPARIDIRGTLTCGQDVFIDVNCVFIGDVKLEDGAQIGPNCYIKDSTIGKGAEIRPFCHLDGAVVGGKALVGPYARLRPGADLGEEVHIGNFVEIKNSKIADNSKANHLAYIGDSTVGARVNIGAGAITCNYDGVNKHRTVIGDDAFIGTNCQLVAPIKVGSGATIGAGTTLTRDAPAGVLTVSRVRQTTIRTWDRPKKNKK